MSSDARQSKDIFALVVELIVVVVVGLVVVVVVPWQGTSPTLFRNILYGLVVAGCPRGATSKQVHLGKFASMVQF